MEASMVALGLPKSFRFFLSNRKLERAPEIKTNVVTSALLRKKASAAYLSDIFDGYLKLSQCLDWFPT